jgi:general secretion pathway protein C
MKLIGKLPCRPVCRGQLGKASLPALVSAVLAVALVLRLALPLWAAMSPESEAGSASASAGLGSSNAGPDLIALQSLDLFGAAAPLATTESAPAMNTSLSLRLEGVVIASEAGESLAVIASGGQRGSYRSGDALPAGASIRVDSIARDHVVIDNRGQREIIWLFTGGNSIPAPAGTALAGNPQVSLPPGTDARVLKTAARLAEIISVSPEQSNGSLIGYRLAPGARLKDFVNLGFEEGDIVTAVNGIALNDVANLPKLYGLMDGASEVSFSLLRKGTPQSLNVTLAPENSSRQ